MNSEERSPVRQSLLDAEFNRTEYGDDLSGHGDYLEWWRHADGSTIRIEWGWRALSPTTQPPSSESGMEE